MADVTLPVKQLKTVPTFVLGSLEGTPPVLTSPRASLANRFELFDKRGDDSGYKFKRTAVAFALPG